MPVFLSVSSYNAFSTQSQPANKGYKQSKCKMRFEKFVAFVLVFWIDYFAPK